MEKTKVFGALRATTLAALTAGGLMFAATGCSSTADGDGAEAAKSAEKSCGGDKQCGGEKQCGGAKDGAEKSCGGEKSCGEKSCG